MDILKGLICFVSGFVSFLYATRVCWGCGRSCSSQEKPEIKKQTLRGSLPAATALYLFGFMILFSYIFDGFLTIYVFSLTSSILISHFVVSMSMPELKRKTKIENRSSLENFKYDAS